MPVNPGQELSRRLLKVPLAAIAEAIGKDETAACRIRANERPCTLSEWVRLLDAAGLKLVDKNKLCVNRDQFNFMRQTTARAISNEQTARMLFEEPE